MIQTSCFVRLKDLQCGDTVSCGCIKRQNQLNNYKKRTDFVDGTSLSTILGTGTRTINKNNRTGHVGVSYDKKRKSTLHK